MSLTDNMDRVAFSGRHTTDKIVRIFTGTYDSGDLETRVGGLGTIYVYKIAHGLTRPVFCDLITSTDGGTTWDLGISKIAFSDDTYVYIFHGFATTGTPVDYKVYCTWIDNYDATDPLVDVQTYSSNPVQFDGRLNYQKVHSQDVVTIDSATEVITHDLGYTPNAKVFFEALPNEVWPLNIGGASNPFLYESTQVEAGAAIYDDRLEITTDSGSARCWWRIYYDTT